MIRDGLFDTFPMEAIFGIHNWPSLPAGQFAWKVGPIMAAAGVLSSILGFDGQLSVFAPYDGPSSS